MGSTSGIGRYRAHRRSLSVALLCASFLSLLVPGNSLEAAVSEEARRQGIVECTDDLRAKHNPDLAASVDHLICFEAYISNFDTDDDDDGDGEPDVLGVPHWVVQKISRARSAPESRKRPRAWFTVPELQKRQLAPTDGSYKFSADFRKAHPNWFDRGHLAQKYLAERISPEAAWFTHNVANAVPQRSRFNSGPWLQLECYTGAWANRHGDIWVITGPIFTSGRPSGWLAEPGRKVLPVAIPDAMFKIVVRKGPGETWQTLAFIYPQDDPSYRKGPWDPAKRLTSISRIERLTRVELLSAVKGSIAPPKTSVATELWRLSEDNFDPGCRKFSKGAS